MAGKKTKPRKPAKKPDIVNLKPSDVLCPICRTILIEPVSLPCNHAFCKLCFEGTMENANLVCPLCRVRVGSWFRKAKKEGNLVDEDLWEAIQRQYASEVQNRYQGIDNVMESDIPVIIVATPGEIRKEYEQQRQKDLEELKKIREAEEKASAPLIKKLAEEEEQKRRLEEEKLRLDAALAKKLAEDLEKSSASLFTPKKVTKFDGGKKYGPMDRFIKSTEKDSKPNRLSINRSEERRRLDKSERKKISITPNPTTNFATKEYTCHVINAEGGSVNIVNPFSILNKTNYNKPTYSGAVPTVQRKIKQARKIIETEERKSICKSGYKSSESGSDDTIDQECKFYFKPIDTQRRYHLPGTVPVKVPSLKGSQATNVCIGPPKGKVINLHLGTVISAFARFSMSSEQILELSQEVIEEETSDQHALPPKRVKRKITQDDSPSKRKGRRLIFAKKNNQNIDNSKALSSPFYGFDTLAIKESNHHSNVFKQLLVKNNYNKMNKESVVSNEELYTNFRTHSRLQNRPQNSENPLKLSVAKTKNGINMSEAIKNKLAELRNSLDGPSENSNRDNQYKIGIDINRNIPRLSPQATTSKLNLNQIRGSLDSNSTDANITFKVRASPKIIGNSVDEPSSNSSSEYKKHFNFSNQIKNSSKSIDFRSNDVDTSKIGYGNKDNKKLRNDFELLSKVVKNDLLDTILNSGCDLTTSPRKARSSRFVNDCKSTITSADMKETSSGNRQESSDTNPRLSFDSSASPTGKIWKPENSSSPINCTLTSSCRRKHESGSPRKVKNSLNKAVSENVDNAITNNGLILDTVVSGDKFALASDDTFETGRLEENSSKFVNTLLCNTSPSKTTNFKISEPRKTRNTLNKKHMVSVTGENPLSMDYINPTHIEDSNTASIRKDPSSDIKSKSERLEEVPINSVNKIFHVATNSSNSKITDTYSKAKSPPKSRNNGRKLKLSPRKGKINNMTEESEALQINGEINIEERQMQEESDFELAKKLQAEFDLLQMSSRTRRGTKRQITLDEMLSI